MASVYDYSWCALDVSTLLNKDYMEVPIEHGLVGIFREPRMLGLRSYIYENYQPISTYYSTLFNHLFQSSIILELLHQKMDYYRNNPAKVSESDAKVIEVLPNMLGTPEVPVDSDDTITSFSTLITSNATAIVDAVINDTGNTIIKDRTKAINYLKSNPMPAKFTTETVDNFRYVANYLEQNKTVIETKLDGTIVETKPDGSSITTKPDGTVIENNGKGTITTTKTDGSSFITYPDGSKKDISSNGTITEVSADGNTTRVTTPNGETTTTVVNPDGTTTVTKPDGSVDIIQNKKSHFFYKNRHTERNREYLSSITKHRFLY